MEKRLRKRKKNEGKELKDQENGKGRIGKRKRMKREEEMEGED